MLNRGELEQISTEYEKGVESRRFDHGGHEAVETETLKETQGHFTFDVATVNRFLFLHFFNVTTGRPPSGGGVVVVIDP